MRRAPQGPLVRPIRRGLRKKVRLCTGLPRGRGRGRHRDGRNGHGGGEKATPGLHKRSAEDGGYSLRALARGEHMRKRLLFC